jgi:hypothetical protein
MKLFAATLITIPLAAFLATPDSARAYTWEPGACLEDEARDKQGICAWIDDTVTIYARTYCANPRNVRYTIDRFGRCVARTPAHSE